MIEIQDRRGAQVEGHEPNPIRRSRMSRETRRQRAPSRRYGLMSSLLDKLALTYLESSTLTPLIKRLESMRLLTRTRNPLDERQVRSRHTMTRPYSIASKQKMVERPTEKDAVSAIQLARENPAAEPVGGYRRRVAFPSWLRQNRTISNLFASNLTDKRGLLAGGLGSR
jgi:hypothetical protein